MSSNYKPLEESKILLTYVYYEKTKIKFSRLFWKFRFWTFIFVHFSLSKILLTFLFSLFL